MITIEIDLPHFVAICILLCAAFALYAILFAMDVKKFISIRRHQKRSKEKTKEKENEK